MEYCFCHSKEGRRPLEVVTGLREMNHTMKKLGIAQPGLLQINFVPAGYAIKILDLKSCFFTIPLHPKDRERFAFSVPTNNNATPCARYQWTVLPQGMKNSPTLCQIYVSQALQPFLGLPPLSIIHYMDDILLSHPDATQLTCLFPQVINRLNKFGLQVANEKIQSQYPFQFLGGTLLPGGLTMRPPKLTIKDKMTLNELQKLLG
jgi:hypothetical protein